MSGEERLINGRRLYLERRGPPEGAPVLLLHHGLGSTHSWRGQAAYLAQAGFQVAAYDRWGYGRSEPRAELSVPGFADDVSDLGALLDELEWPQVSLVGHSDGGTIALYYAAAHPQRVSALVVVAAHVYVEEKMIPGIEAVRWAFENDPRFREGLRRQHGENTGQVFYNWYHAWRQPSNQGWDMRPLLGLITCPTLVVQGLLDEHATPQHARDLAQSISGAQVWLLEGANHMLPQEAGLAFNPRLLAFLSAALHPGHNGRRQPQTGVGYV